MYEYVEKNEYNPVKSELELIIHKIQDFMGRKCNTTFKYELVGSGGRHLITRLMGGNGGYDFDYNFIIHAPDDGCKYKSDIVKQQFTEAVKYAIKDTKYGNPSDKASAITIKVVDTKNSKIEHACDFAIVYYEKDEPKEGYYILKHNKTNNTYDFIFRENSKQLGEKIQEIKDYFEEGWNEIRKEYLKLKNSNKDSNKRSSDLFLEAVHNILNWIDQDRYDDQWDDDEEY